MTDKFITCNGRKFVLLAEQPFNGRNNEKYINLRYINPINAAETLSMNLVYDWEEKESILHDIDTSQ
jgi:hypothetical protein